MEKGPAKVARLAEGERDANWRFRAYTKMVPLAKAARIDRLAERLGREAEAQMDCASCAACCRNNWVPVNDEEAARLARCLGLSVQEFQQEYLTTHELEWGIDAKPCPFLDDKLCTVYEDRPDCCRGYPYVGGQIAPRMWGIIERAEVCPIIYEMLEQLKQRLNFRA